MPLAENIWHARLHRVLSSSSFLKRKVWKVKQKPKKPKKTLDSVHRELNLVTWDFLEYQGPMNQVRCKEDPKYPEILCGSDSWGFRRWQLTGELSLHTGFHAYPGQQLGNEPQLRFSLVSIISRCIHNFHIFSASQGSSSNR